MSLYLFITSLLVFLPAAVSQTYRLYKYDVFLSFRGETRYGFTNDLREALHKVGITTFRDSSEIRGGENIPKAIKKGITESSMSVVVFSENFAKSTWCLEELAMAMKLVTTSEHTVLPIFYHVDSSIVREKKGKYVAAIAEHEKSYNQMVGLWKAGFEDISEFIGMFSSSEVREQKEAYNLVRAEIVELLREKVKGWKAALKKVPLSKGIVVERARNESEYIQDILQEIAKMLNRTVPNVAPSLVSTKDVSLIPMKKDVPFTQMGKEFSSILFIILFGFHRVIKKAIYESIVLPNAMLSISWDHELIIISDRWAQCEDDFWHTNAPRIR